MENGIQSRMVGEDVFAVVKGKQRMLYAPKKGLAVKGWTASMARWVVGLFPDITMENPCVPTVEMDITRRCNLRCVYCSVKGGDSQALVDSSVTRAAVNTLIEDAVDRGCDTAAFMFGCRGEPTNGWNELKKTIEHIKSKAAQENVTPLIYVPTNGIISAPRLTWLANNTTHIVLSFDGPAEIQNKQRPLGGNNKQESFDVVKESAELLSSLDANFSLRATISMENIDLVKVVEFLAKFNPASIFLAPIIEAGRCLETGCKSVPPDLFLTEYRKAKRYADANGIRLASIGTRIDGWIGVSCDFVVTSTGFVTVCDIAKDARLGDEFPKDCSVGRLKGDFISLDYDNLERLRRIEKSKKAFCRHCFARSHCNIACFCDPDSMDSMCYIIKALLWDSLSERIEQ